ncbi:MAG: DUF6122 family protein [bacterium]
MTASLWSQLHTPVHLTLHALLPLGLALLYWRHQWKRAWLVMLAANLVDLDHLLATPIFAPDRCSLTTHPLHGYVAIACYVIAAAVAKRHSPWRMLAVGLLLHVGVDALDYYVLQ